MSVSDALLHPLRRRQSRRPGLAEEAALAAIVRSSPDAVIAKTAEGVITAWNAGATAVYGYTAEFMTGRNVEMMFPSESAAEERVRHDRVARGHAESGYRCRRLRVDGRAIDVVMSMSPVRDEDGKVIGVASISRPVSDREQAETRYASLLDATPDGMLCVDIAGIITMANAQITELVGYSRAELVGSTVEMLLPDAVHAQHRAHREGFLRQPRARQMGVGMSLTARHRDGSTFPVEVSLNTDGTGDDMVVIAAIRDVSRQRHVEESVRLSEARLRQLAEHVDTVFILRQLDPPGYLYVSPGIKRLTGYEPGELLDHPTLLTELLQPDDLTRVAEYRAGAATGVPTRMELRFVRPDGVIRWVRVSDIPVPNPHGGPERSVTSMEDITERVEATAALREAEATARAANDAKSLFLSRMSHELRTPLNAVLGFGQLLERSLTDDDDLMFVQHILGAGKHLLGLINEVLDITRIESGEMSVSLEPVDAVRLIHETVELIRPLADDTHVELLTSPPHGSCHVLADRQRLRQVLLNLVSNAVKYNRPGGHVWISWEVADDRISVVVRDDGRGIPPALQSRLFTPFDRLNAESTGVEGTGVGLAVTQSLMTLMNGSIQFASDGEHGSTFTVIFPAAIAVGGDFDAHQTVREPLLGDPQRSAPAILLYVEDNDRNVRVIESLMRLRPDWRILHAGLGGAGLELAAEHRPDLMLLDLHLPDIPGLEVLTALKQNPVTAHIPVVVLSADASTNQKDVLLDAGAARYLTKPVDLTVVLTLLDDVTASKRPARWPQSGTDLHV